MKQIKAIYAIGRASKRLSEKSANLGGWNTRTCEGEAHIGMLRENW